MYRHAKAPNVPPRPAAVEPVGRNALGACASYAMVILTVSWVLGPIGEFVVRLGADPVLASFFQSGAALLLLAHAAGWIVRTFGVSPRPGLRLAIGLGAVVIFVACDVLSALLLFGLSPLDLTTGMTGPQGVVIAVMLTVTAILPALRSREV
jgi:hypothetical protein